MVVQPPINKKNGAWKFFIRVPSQVLSSIFIKVLGFSLEY